MSDNLRFGVDCDGVLYDWGGTARFLLEHHFNHQQRIPDSAEWNFLKDYCGDDQWDWLWSDAVNEYGLFRHGNLYRGSVEALKELAQMGDVSIVTHRPKAAVLDTYSWIAHHRLPASNVYILHNQEPKWKIEPQFHFFLDDKPENVTEYYEHSDAVVAVWDRLWNQNRADIPAGVIRVNSWAEVIDLCKNEVSSQLTGELV